MALAIASAGSRANRKDNPMYIEVLNSPPFYTSGDCVQGQLLVEPTTKPKRISISLKGFSAVQDANGKTFHIEFYGSSQYLYVYRDAGDDFQLLAKNTTSPPKVELPFSFTVGQHATIPPPAGRVWFHSTDSYNHPRFQHSPGFPLPPTLDGSTPTSPRVVYHLEAYLESDLPNSQPVKIRQEITYMPPAPDFNPDLLQPDLNFGTKLPKHCSRQKLIRTRKLFPDYSEKHSKLSRFKDKLVAKELLFGLESFAEIPYVQFNLFATPASVLVTGSPIPVIVTVQHIKRSESLAAPPDLFLRRLKVQLNAMVNVFVPGESSGRHATKITNLTEKKTIVLCDQKYEKEQGELLYDGLNLLDVANIELSKDDKIVPSFTSYGMNLEYELQIEISGGCADREWSGIACTQPVQVVTDWQAAPVGATNPFEAGPEPAYQEYDPMPQIQETCIDRRAQGTEGEPRAYEPDSRFMTPHIADSVPPPEYKVSH